MPPRRTPLMEIPDNDATSSPLSTADDRRKSGRAVKAPEKLADAAAFAQARNAGAKRKRGTATENDENDASDVEDDEDDDEDDEDDDEESEEEQDERPRKARQTKKSATRKPAAKKPKINGTTQTAGAVTLPNRPKKSRKVAIEDVEVEGLYGDVFTSSKDPDIIAQQWLKQYRESAGDAMKDLVNMVLRSSGCDIEITTHDIEDPDNVPNKLSDLQDEYQAQNIVDYPLISKARSNHIFRSSLAGFFESLVLTMHESRILYDDPALIENLHLWITTMSSSILRPFRHTATVISLGMASTLCSVARDEGESTAKTLRQIEGEKRKKGGNKGRIATFQKALDDGNQRRELCVNTIRDFFDTVFVHRYRDVDPKVRTECVEALGKWIVNLPDVFFDAQYLRYLGWMMSDIVGTTRHEVIKQLERMMKSQVKEGGLTHFFERFRPRLVEIAAQDSEAGVRASAAELLGVVRRAGLLEPDDIDTIGRLIFDSEPRVRRAVVNFFVENIKDLLEQKIEDLGGEEVLDDAFPAEEIDFESPRPEWLKLKCLAELLVGYDSEDAEEGPNQADAFASNGALNTADFESRFALAAQAIHDKVPEIKAWEIIAGYLLYDHSAKGTIDRALKESFRLDEQEEAILLDIMNSSIKQILHVGDEYDRARDKSKKRSAPTESSEVQESTARRLAALIPQLLKKFGARPKTAIAVLRLEHVVNLGVFQQLRQDSTAYAKLLDEISAQFTGHADPVVLNEATAALLHARSYEELEDITEVKLQALWEDTLSSLQQIARANKISVRGNMSKAHLHQLSNNLARVDKLAGISNCVDVFESTIGNSNETPLSLLLGITERGRLEESDPEIDDLEDGAICSAARAMLLYFMWKTLSLKQSIEKSERIKDSVIDFINEHQNTFSNALIETISSRAGLDDLRLLATGTLLDLRTLFSTLRPAIRSSDGDNKDNNNGQQHQQQHGRYRHLQTLIQELAPEVQSEIASIFASAERQLAKKARKTLEGPAEDDEPEDIDSEPDDDDDDDDDISGAERQSDTLKAEQRLCELTGKIVLGLVARIIDTRDPLRGKLRVRVQRNRLRLGPNFREVVAFLDEAKARPGGGGGGAGAAAGKKVLKARAQQQQQQQRQQAATAVAATAAKEKKAMKSKAVVDDEDDEDEGFPAAEESEDEAADGGLPESEDEEAENGGAADEEEEESVLGD